MCRDPDLNTGQEQMISQQLDKKIQSTVAFQLKVDNKEKECWPSQPTYSLTVIQRLFVGPVGPLLDILEMRVLLTQSRVEHRDLHSGTFGVGMQKTHN